MCILYIYIYIEREREIVYLRFNVEIRNQRACKASRTFVSTLR